MYSLYFDKLVCRSFQGVFSQTIVESRGKVKKREKPSKEIRPANPNRRTSKSVFIAARQFRSIGSKNWRNWAESGTKWQQRAKREGRSDVPILRLSVSLSLLFSLFV